MSDIEFISVEFEFEGSHYYSLIRKKRQGNTTNYFITIMNGDLERLLFGNHIITEIDGRIQLDNNIQDPRLAGLKSSITRALQKTLHKSREQTPDITLKTGR